MGNTSSTPEHVIGVGGRKRTLRKRTRRGGQRAFGGDLMMQEAYGGRKRTLRKRTRRGGQRAVWSGGRKRTRRGGRQQRVVLQSMGAGPGMLLQ